MVSKRSYTVHVADFGDCSGRNLLIEILDSETGKQLFVKKYRDPKEARKDYEKALTADNIETWGSEVVDFSQERYRYRIIAHNRLLHPERFTYLGRAMFSDPPISDLLEELVKEQTALFDPKHYITSKEKKKIAEGYAKIIATLQESCQNLDRDVNIHNIKHVSEALVEEKEYLDNIFKDSSPEIKLDEEQRIAVITDEDHCLLIAGAGTGKTTTMAAKVKYLVEQKGIDSKDILVLSYTKKAVDDLTKKIEKKLGIKAKLSTFHKLGLEYVKKRKANVEVMDRDDKIILEIIQKLLVEPEELKKLIHFFGFYFDIDEETLCKNHLNLDKYHEAKLTKEYETFNGCIRLFYEKKEKEGMTNWKTFAGEFVRSDQEVRIANFLYLNSIDYEYEKEYKERISGSGKKYTPDFYLTQDGREAYLEHYSLSESGMSNKYDEDRTKTYKKRIEDKRIHHATHRTRLIETWSSYNDGMDLLWHLEKILKENGFILKPRDPKEVFNKLKETGKNKYIFKFANFIGRFIELYKIKGYGADGFNKLRDMDKSYRTNLFLDITEKVYSEYMKKLQKDRAIDFADMINQANDYFDECYEKNIRLNFKYILIDEYQDITPQRFDLVKKLSRITDAKIVAVGDDWQSIYAFAGSDITLLTNFKEILGHAIELKICSTYRLAQELIDIAGKFIQENPKQINKKLKSAKSISEPIVIRPYNDWGRPLYARGEAVDKIIGEITEECGEESSIMLLGRYGFDKSGLVDSGFFEYNNFELRSKKYPKAKLTFMTAHGSKGLEADNVVIINMSEGKYGFPCKIEEDPIMRLVTPEDRNIEYAEERRLFYVALTRTLKKVYIAAPSRKPSQFLLELMKEKGIKYEQNEESEIDVPSELCCVDCGFPLKYEYNKSYQMWLYVCTNDPEVCGFMTNHRKYHMCGIKKCPDPDCDGYLVVKTSAGDPLYGCTNYKFTGCRMTESISEEDIRRSYRA